MFLKKYPVTDSSSNYALILTQIIPLKNFIPIIKSIQSIIKDANSITQKIIQPGIKNDHDNLISDTKKS